MILCDSNVWLALALSEHVHHRAATQWLDGVVEPASINFCRASQQSFLRLLTNAAVLRPYGNPPLTNSEAWRAFEALLADDRIMLSTHEPSGLESRWRRLALRDTASPKLWMDAYLAAYALAARWMLVTTDKGFLQFPGLRVTLLGETGSQ